MAQNDTANVSVGKGVVGGYLFAAPVGTELPTDYSSALDAAFQNCGFLSDEGVTFTQDASNDTFHDLNGDVVLTAASSIEHSLAVQFIEVNEVSLKEVFGQENVAVADDGALTVSHKNTEMERRSLVGEFVLRDGRRFRKVIPNAQVTSWEDMTIVSSELYMLPVTYTEYPDKNGAYEIDYIQPAGGDSPTPPVPPTPTEPSITLNQHTANLTVGGTRQLKATTVPADAEVTWGTLDDSVATVADGLVTATGVGSTDIEASITVDGEIISDACAVNVTE